MPFASLQIELIAWHSHVYELEAHPGHYPCRRQSAFLMYQSVPSLTIHPGDPREFARFHCPRLGFFTLLSLPGASGFWIREISYSSERQMQGLLDLFQRNRSSLKSKCCFTSICKNSRCLLYLEYQRQFSVISVILIKFSGHPRVIFANARSSLKFWVSYVARFIVNIRCVSRLFPRVFLIYCQSMRTIEKVGLNCLAVII